ncbi:T9SS type A sorting domain-containing protein [Neolewinella maritima]|nr:T9SS type A sorting domain-containing protein [Neolewinella maritima]
MGRGSRVVALLLLFALSFSAADLRAQCENVGTTYLQDNTNGDGLVVMEAERPTNYHGSTRAGHGPEVIWSERTRSTANQGGYVIVGTVEQNAYELPADGAHLDYRINFTTTGTYYIYFRHAAAGDRDNSIHILVDGVVVQATQQFGFGTRQWDWRWERAAASFAINTTGDHTITIAHREDGLAIDRMVVTTDPARSFDRRGPQTTEAGSNTGAAALTTLAVYEQDTITLDGLVVMEAERPTRSIRGQQPFLCREWVAATNDLDASELSFVYVEDQNSISDSFNYYLAPRLDYEVTFKRTGRHYIHLRHKGTAPGDNSVWTNFDYSDEDRFKMNINTGDWQWETIGRDASFVVPDTGTYIVSIYMREDDTPIDKILISPDASYRTSTALGPDATETAPLLVYQQSSSDNYPVDMPAEVPSAVSAGKGAHAGTHWYAYQDDDAIDDRYAMVPDAGVRAENSLDVPMLHYAIDFVQTGQHYLYLRHRSVSNGNSVAVYFDGTLVSSHVAMPIDHGNTWTYTRMNPTIDVNSLGRHTLSILMREDGTPLDHIIMSTSPNMTTASLAASSLPVELTSFTGQTDARSNSLYWTTVHEDNTATHVVERLAEGQADWQSVGEVTAAGSSTEALDYSFVDARPVAKAYYRIRTLDYDGTATVSDVITLTRNSTAATTSVSVFPNPTTDRVTLSYEQPTDGTMTVRLFSLSGQQVMQRTAQVEAGSNETTLYLSELAAGAYLLSAQLPSGALIQERIVVR